MKLLEFGEVRPLHCLHVENCIEVTMVIFAVDGDAVHSEPCSVMYMSLSSLLNPLAVFFFFFIYIHKFI